jgi:hypothetical protein
VTQIARPGCLLDLSTPTHLSLCAWHKAVCVSCFLTVLIVIPLLLVPNSYVTSISYLAEYPLQPSAPTTNERRSVWNANGLGYPGLFLPSIAQHRPLILAAHIPGGRRRSGSLVACRPSQGLAPGGGMFTTVKKRRSVCCSQNSGILTLFARSLAFAVKDCIIVPAAATVQSGLHDMILFIHSGQS